MLLVEDGRVLLVSDEEWRGLVELMRAEGWDVIGLRIPPPSPERPLGGDSVLAIAATEAQQERVWRFGEPWQTAIGMVYLEEGEIDLGLRRECDECDGDGWVQESGHAEGCWGGSNCGGTCPVPVQEICPSCRGSGFVPA